jgi:hypothetical protein
MVSRAAQLHGPAASCQGDTQRIHSAGDYDHQSAKRGPCLLHPIPLRPVQARTETITEMEKEAESLVPVRLCSDSGYFVLPMITRPGPG